MWLIEKGLIEMESGLYSQSLATLTRAEELAPKDFRVKFNQGVTF